MIGSCIPTRLGEAGTLSVFTFRRDDSQILGETLRFSRRFTSQRGREKIYNCKFSKVTSLRKEVSGTYSQVLTGTN